MNELLVRNLIRYKLNAAEAIVERLPLEISKEIKALGRVILESLNEGSQEMKKQPDKETKPSNNLKNVIIE
jgi:hypothetical protein